MATRSLISRFCLEDWLFVNECVRMFLDGETDWNIQEIADFVTAETGVDLDRRRLSDLIITTRKERHAQAKQGRSATKPEPKQGGRRSAKARR